MNDVSSPRGELGRLWELAVPVMAAQVGMMAMSTVDTLMVARVDVDSLAAAAIANAWIWGVLIFCQGVLHGIDPIVTQAHGAGRGERAGLALQHGAVLAIALSIPAALALASTRVVLEALGQSPELARLGHAYARVQIPSIPCFLLYLALRQYLQGRELVRPAMWAVGVANLFNVLANWALIFGHLGSPALGLVGAGIATSVTRALILLVLAGLVWRLDLQRGAWVPIGAQAFDGRALWRVLALGSPVALQMGLEVCAFSTSTLIVGRLGPSPLSAHAIVLNLASLTFMLPLGLSQGAVTRVGNLIGAGRPRSAQLAAWVALGSGAGVMAIAAAVFVIGRHGLPALYTDDTTVRALAASILPIAGAFQIFDGIQVVGGGVLRGMGRTRPAAWIHLMGWWMLALPLAAWLALRAAWGVQGVWWGLCAGLAVISLLLVGWILARGPERDALVVAG